jgi:hypothetical protein
MALLIPAELLTHPAIESHPHILALHEQHGGIPEQDVEEALDFANAVATQAVEPGTKSRRTDPSPRRTARVWRSQLLGRDPSVSPERGRDGFAGGDVTVRYRSRSRPPTTATVLEEAGEMRVGRPEAPRAVTGAAHLENRVGTVVQQQHEFNRRVDVVEKRVEAADAR